MTQDDKIKQLLSDVRMQFKHVQACSGTRKKAGMTIPCPLCEHGMKLFSEVPGYLLAEVLSEPIFPVEIQMVTLIVDSTFNRGTHNTKRAQADCAAGMRLLKDYQDSGGKLRTSTPLSL